MPSERWHCFIIFSQKTLAVWGYGSICLHYPQAFLSPWGSSDPCLALSFSLKFQWSFLFHSLFWNQTLYSIDAQRTVATNLTVSSSKRKTHPQFEVHQLGSSNPLPWIHQTLNGVHVPLQFRIMSDHRSNFPLQPFVHKFFTNLTKTFIGRYLCLADSGKPFCIVVKHPQFEVSILLLGIDKTFISTLSQTLIEHWRGWWDPPFQFVTLSDYPSSFPYIFFPFIVK